MNAPCTRPIPSETLVDYWAGELSGEAAGAVEEHLFGCASCNAEAERVGAVTEAVRGVISPVVSRRNLAALEARGLRVRENAFIPGERRNVAFPAEVDLLVHRLGGLELTGVERVSIEIRSESSGELISAFDAAPFEEAEGAVLIACQHHYAALPHDTVFDVSVHAPGGVVRAASYTILHEFVTPP